jgi:hypothetical protein
MRAPPPPLPFAGPLPVIPPPQATPCKDEKTQQAQPAEIPRLAAPVMNESPNGLSPGKRRLSTQELKSYNAVIKALSAEGVKLSLMGQSSLRDIIKGEAFWMD